MPSVATAIRMVMLLPGAVRQCAPVIFGTGLSGCVGQMAADDFRSIFMLFRKLCGGLCAVAVGADEGVGSRRFPDKNRR